MRRREDGLFEVRRNDRAVSAFVSEEAAMALLKRLTDQEKSEKLELD
jgi:hypothetical protein